MNSEPHVNVPGRRWRRRARLVGLVIAMTAASAGLWPPGSATAAVTAVTVRYACPGGQSLAVQIAARMPPGAVVGKPIPAVTVTATASISTIDTALLRAGGVSSIDGSADAAAVVVAPDRTADTTLHLVVSPTRVPSSGQMAFHAAGALPRLTFHRSGHAAVDVGTSLNVTATLRNAGGKPIVNSGHFSCTLDGGQHTEILSFTIGR